MILEFESLEATQACYDSPEYQKALVFARKAVVRDAIIVEGAQRALARQSDAGLLT